MERIESKVEPGRLLHIVHRLAEMRKYGREVSARFDLVPNEEGIQVACLKLVNKQTFKAHKHVPRCREIPRTQECWVVIEGIVSVLFYDLDGSLLCRKTLYVGDSSITLEGGHNYVCHTTPSIVYEFKTGPYVGVEADKELIGD